MKISSASKKVLASALSAAMVVAFSPAVALGATNTGGNAYYGEVAIGHNLDNGVVTKAPTCTTEGIMTYTCADGDGYTVVAPIAKTTGHTIAVDTASKFDVDGTLDGFNWVKNGDGWDVTGYFKCSEGELSQSATVAAVKTAETPATFYAAGSTTWTAKVKDALGNEYTTTKTVTDEVIAPVNLKAEIDTIAAPNVFTDGYSLARIKLVSGAKSQTLTAATTASVETPSTEAVKGKTKYTAVFDMPEGVYFGKGVTVGDYNTTNSTYAVDIADLAGTTGISAKVKAGKLYVSTVVQDEDFGTVHVAAAEGTATNSNVATDTEGNQAYTSGDGVKIIYSGKGSLVAGTASATEGVWTIEVNCKTAGHSTKVVAEKQVAKVSKATCPGKTLYTVEYAGGSYKLFAGGDAKAAHTYIAGESVWTTDGAGFHVSTDYVCPVDGDKYTVNMNSAGDAEVSYTGAGTSLFTGITLKAAKADASVKATHTAKGTIDFQLSLANVDGASDADKAALANAIAKVGITGQSIKLPTAMLVGDDSAQINWVGTSSAVVTVKCAAADIYDVKTYNLSATHVNAKLAADGTFTPGYTVYSSDIALPAGVTGIAGAVTTEVNGTYTNGAVFYDAKTKTYSVKKVVTDKVSSVVSSANKDDDGLFLTSDVSKWTVSDDGKAYAVTAISTADIDHSIKAPYVQKAYTLTYNNGKTVTVECTGTKLAHKFVVDHFAIKTQNADKTIATIQAILVCPDCGETVTLDAVTLTGDITKYEVKAGRDYNGTMGTLALKDGTVIGTYNVGKYVATSSVYSNEPTFEWDTTGYLPTAEATFVSADGKMKVTVPCKVTLTDAATSTWTATVEKKYIPEGFSGKVLSETKVINLHEGHSMVLTGVTKATTTSAGFATYFCNNCAKDYKVEIAKNNMKVSPTSKSFKASAVKKAAKSFTIKVTNAKGKVSYKASSAAKKAGVTVSSKGKVTVKKGTAKGTYKVTVTSAATDTYAKVTKTVSIKVK